MKTLYMVRHAKSSWKHDLIDHQRPLKGRGKRDGELMSTYLAETITKPQLLITSDAVRALSTAHYFKRAFSIEESEFMTNSKLYDFSGQAVLDIIKGLDQTYERIMIVGHNHAFTSIANMLGNTYIENVPTCGFVQLEFEVDKWADITVGKTKLIVFPKELKK